VRRTLLLRAGGDTSEEAYQAYLCEYVDACGAIVGTQKDEFKELINAGDYVSFPAEMLFGGWFPENAMTYDEFVAADGVYTIPDSIRDATAD